MRRTLLATLALLVVAGPASAQESASWSHTLERISSGVVSIRVDGTRAFDTEWNQSTQATGFVVDAERGLILTNRHVVMPGPVIAEAVFINHEEVDLRPIYRDPVHDFGIFRYDPKDLQFITPYEFELKPALAQIGREIRVVGNDAGEQLSILAGTIARLDRRAPDYGRGKYNDFNTFYIQAASSTSGGSSGSPVIEISGSVVALNAGGSAGAASSFFLPLDRIVRALDKVRVGETVPRGTLQTTLLYRPYEELRRLGLTVETEARVREQFPDNTGMLVVSQVVPGGPADGLLEPGDIVLSVEGERVVTFVALDDVIDSSVGKDITIELQRGAKRIEHALTVGDLHGITPSEFFELGDTVLHTLSYQQARHLNQPPRGVFVASPGYMLSRAAIPRGSVITELDRNPVDDLDDIVDILGGLADNEQVTVRFYTFDEPQNPELRPFHMVRNWFPARRCQRDDVRGFWPCESLNGGPEPVKLEAASTRFIPHPDPRANKLAASLVLVNFDLPYGVSGVSERHYYGTGLVVDTEHGYVVVDRNTVPVEMGDVKLTFASSLEVPGRVEFIHPLHNLAIVAYDPALIGDTPVRAASFSTRSLEQGDDVWVIGLKPDQKLKIQETEISSIDAISFPLSRTFRFRETNVETVSVVNAPSDIDGVLVDKRGNVAAMWSSFAFQGGGQVNMGMPSDLVVEMLDIVKAGGTLRSLETEFALLPLAGARNLGLDDDWVRKLEKHNPERRQALRVVRVVAEAPASGVLRSGDLLLAIDGLPVNTYRGVEKRVRNAETVRVTIWRDDEAREFDIDTVQLAGEVIDRVLVWAGAQLQRPHRAMAAQRGIPREGVYVSFFGYGSPASRYGLWAGRRIIEVDGLATPDLDAFWDAVKGKGDRDSVRVKTVAWNDVIDVITLKLDLHYWPAYEMQRSDDGWTRLALD